MVPVYIIQLKDQKTLANLFKPINIPSGTPKIIPSDNPKNTLKRIPYMSIWNRI